MRGRGSSFDKNCAKANEISSFFIRETEEFAYLYAK